YRDRDARSGAAATGTGGERMRHPLAGIASFAAIGLAATAGGIMAVLGDELRYLVLAEPWWLASALLPIAAVVVRHFSSPRPATLRFSRATSLQRIGSGWAARLVHLPDGFRLAAALLLAVALARPQSTRGSDRLRHEGIDIVITLDLSDSMIQ